MYEGSTEYGVQRGNHDGHLMMIRDVIRYLGTYCSVPSDLVVPQLPR
jgi:hypothetical protein